MRGVVAGGLIWAHRDAAPLLEPVEAAFDDVAAAVALPLLVAEVDRSARLLAAVRAPIVAFRGPRRGGLSAPPSPAPPCTGDPVPRHPGPAQAPPPRRPRHPGSAP